LEKDLKERKDKDFKQFKEEFEEYINAGEVDKSDIINFSTGDKIKICEIADDLGFLQFKNSLISPVNLSQSIISDCCFALNQLVNEEAFDLVSEMKKFMDQTRLKVWQLIDKINSNF